MNKKITILREDFEIEQTGETVEGITIIVDGLLKDFFEIILQRSSKYKNNLEIVQDALMKGLEGIRTEL